tara:strand:+ start:2504 stop:3151 length:648 start_codon:yes stop_codon:yes gene_type:complete
VKILLKPIEKIVFAVFVGAFSLGAYSYLAHSQHVHSDMPMSADNAHALHADNIGAVQPSFVSPLSDIIVGFELVDRHGNLVSNEDFLGEYLLLGFGFTHCPNVCPMMAFNMGKALRDTEVKAKGVFVSIDTERDTPTITDEYASRFGDDLVGLGGSIAQINAAANNFKVSYAVTKTQNNYIVQHTSNVFLIDPAGNLVDIFAFSATAETIVQAMR